MGVALGSVEEEVAHTGTRDVFVLGRDVGEDDAGCDLGASPEKGGFAEVGLAEVWEAEEPQDGFWDAGEDA